MTTNTPSSIGRREFLGALGAGAMSAASLAQTGEAQAQEKSTPALKVVEYHVSEAEMRDQCARYMPPLVSPSACTLFYFDRHEAHIYVSKDFPSAQILAHERLHAAGYDHVGSRAMTRLWQTWRAKAGN